MLSHCYGSFLARRLAAHSPLTQDAGSGWPQHPKQHPLADVGSARRQESMEKAYPELLWKNQSWELEKEHQGSGQLLPKFSFQFDGATN